MKAYVRTTGVLFALVVFAHLLRLFQESRELAKDPWFLLATAAAAGLAVWAWWLIRGGKVLDDHPKTPPD